MAWHAAAFTTYLVLTVALTWPLALHVGELVPHDLGDPLLSTAILWWNAEVTPFTSRWWDGFFFYPARDTLTLSDHRVGLGLIATPAVWAGASPLAAHNLVFLATYVLSAAAAYALCFILTRSHTAAFIGGLVFGFSPFRAEHLPHLELLASYWLPIVFVSMHQFVATRRTAWLVALGASLTLQAITCGYYFVFSGVLVGLWLLWFVPRRAPWRDYAGLAAALAAPLVVIAPVLLVYRSAHQEMALARSIDEIEQLSADLLGLITPPDPLWLWNTPESWLRPEGAILIGVTAMALVAAAAWRQRSEPAAIVMSPRSSRARGALLAAAVAAVFVAMVPAVYGPVGFDLGPLRISTSSAYKPLSVATVLFVLWVMTSAGMRVAFRRQSALTFYTLATIAMLAFALGPTARLLGERVLYKAPYSWLMLLPGFADEFRAPARFAMLAALTLSVAAALAFSRFTAARPLRVRQAATVTVSAAILLESWIAPFPLVAAPEPLEIPSAVPADAVVLELPIGTFEDALAMYHATQHLRPVVNGLSGYDAPHYTVLRGALTDRHVDGLSALAGDASIAIFVARGADADDWISLVETKTTARRVAQTSTHEVLLLPPTGVARALAPHTGISLTIRGLSSPLYPENLPRMLDGDRLTAWSSEVGQAGGEEFTVDLGDVQEVRGITMSLGAHLSGFPRLLVIEASEDGGAWTEVWRGATACQAVVAALHAPREAPMWIGLGGRRARFLRLKQLEKSESGWVIAELRVLGGEI